jgi:8-oxo-dGTP pyrophosphatase MutT (NUDIX family)
LSVPRRELHRIETLVRARPAASVGNETAARAAVAMVLAPDEHDLHLLLIRRAEHPLDPWSGHMAFPGGRHDAGDADLVHTAVRETHEEVGVDLARHGRLIGALDEVQASARGRVLDLVITPYLFRVEERIAPSIDETEVAAALWVPLQTFRGDRHHGTTPISRGDFRAEVPAFQFEGHTVWGLTYRMIRNFVEALEEGAARELR